MPAVLLAALVCAGEPVSCAECGSYLYQPAFCMDHVLRGPARRYIPQPGDVFLATDKGFFAKAGHRFAFTAAPQHSGIVVCLPDGTPALLEGGPHNTLRVSLLDLEPQLAGYACKERVWIRRRCVPLTAEQSARLTAFALAVNGKPFAVVRLLGQLTVFRTRTPWNIERRGKPFAAEFCLGDTRGLRRSYYCSELVAEACVAAGLLCPHTTRPAAMYPRDFFFGRSRNKFIDEHLDLSAWEPPARWTSCPGGEAHIEPRGWLDGDGEN